MMVTRSPGVSSSIGQGEARHEPLLMQRRAQTWKMRWLAIMSCATQHGQCRVRCWNFGVMEVRMVLSP